MTAEFVFRLHSIPLDPEGAVSRQDSPDMTLYRVVAFHPRSSPVEVPQRPLADLLRDARLWQALEITEFCRRVVVIALEVRRRRRQRHRLVASDRASTRRDQPLVAILHSHLC